MNTPHCNTTNHEVASNRSRSVSDDHAKVNFPPPLIHGVGIFSALGSGEISPLVLPAQSYLWLPGLGLLFLSFMLAMLSFREFARARNPVPPNQPIQALMTGGPFRYSRNPLYLALALLHGGIAFVSGNAWILLTLPLSLLVVRYYVIAREEAYLIRRFDQTYLDYMARVRRWF